MAYQFVALLFLAPDAEEKINIPNCMHSSVCSVSASSWLGTFTPICLRWEIISVIKYSEWLSHVFKYDPSMLCIDIPDSSVFLSRLVQAVTLRWRVYIRKYLSVHSVLFSGVWCWRRDNNSKMHASISLVRDPSKWFELFVHLCVKIQWILFVRVWKCLKNIWTDKQLFTYTHYCLCFCFGFYTTMIS